MTGNQKYGLLAIVVLGGCTNAGGVHDPPPPWEEKFDLGEGGSASGKGAQSANGWLTGEAPTMGGSSASSDAGSAPNHQGQGGELAVPVEPPPPNVVFLGYEETTGAHKYLILGNRAGGLREEDCRVLVFSNGNTESSRSIPVPAMAAGARVELCTSGAPRENCGGSMGSAPFNGDDALVIQCGAVVTDVFGTVGTDPGVEWRDGTVGTKDTSLVRCHFPNRAPDSPFNVGAEWALWPVGATLDEARTQACGPSAGFGGAAATE